MVCGFLCLNTTCLVVLGARRYYKIGHKGGSLSQGCYKKQWNGCQFASRRRRLACDGVQWDLLVQGKFGHGMCGVSVGPVHN